MEEGRQLGETTNWFCDVKNRKFCFIAGTMR